MSMLVKLKSIVMLSILSSSLLATELQLSGFIGQGYVAADDSQFIVGDNDHAFDITEAAFAVSWKPIEHVRVASALSYRQWGTLYDSAVKFDYLFAEYTYQFGEQNFGARAGLFKSEIGFYSSTRDVPFTRPSIMLPQSIYSDYFRDAQLHVEGGDVFGMHPLFDGMLDWRLTVGKVDITDDFDRNILGRTDFGEFDSEHYYAADVEFQNNNIRLGLTYYDAEVSYSPSAIGGYSPGDIQLVNWVFSGQFRYKNFELTGEYLTGDKMINGLMFPVEFGGFKEPSLGYYLDLRTYLPYEVELFIRFDKHIDNTDDKDGQAYEMRFGSPAYFAYSDDWTFGARWFASHDWLLAVEYHQVEGASWVTPLVSPTPSVQAKEWSMFAMQVSYRFQW
ncbi:hypothetical protein GCM10007978_00910 [Shewanella hanedai]|uniref:Porin n=1 Tax=Shewanella hanedai TaxID=25 RepID=A0A553JUS4_SHEHA|nr:hypothetical protein [Shewanella hanedai]TRY16207.1 hypothetical protein FN961_00830 [Shewanella hanedai]GGI67152.1 hypothetical protein GCM10007978_00910 [Shewanella hanedai]